MRQSQPPNLLDRATTAATAPRTPWWGKILVVIFASAVIGGTLFTYRIVASVSKAFSSNENARAVPLLQQLQQLISPPSKTLQGEEDDIINILLLGMGGDGHDGPLLTDTMMVASMKPSQTKVGLFSIPRDLVANIPGFGYRKINFANAFGEDPKVPGSGVLLSKQVVEGVIGEPIQYWVRVDFSGFAKLIDDLGGVDVTVDTAFTDHEYPTLNHGYQTISFQKGAQHMDGGTALNYVRSRHGNNGEGSDFARSKRQQKILLAVKDKMFSFQTLFNPAAVSNVLTTLGKHIQTNLQPWELLRLASLGKSVDRNTLVNRVLDTTPNGLLVNQTGLDGAYILVPKAGLGKYKDIQQAFATLLDPTAKVESASLEIQNGTLVAGLGARAATEVKGPYLDVLRVRNAKIRNVLTTIIFDLTNGTKPNALALLLDHVHADVFSASTTNGNASAPVTTMSAAAVTANARFLEQLRADATYAGIDFVVLLGADQAAAIQTNSSPKSTNAS